VTGTAAHKEAPTPQRGNKSHRVTTGNTKIVKGDAMWNAEGGWLKRKTEPSVFDICLNDIIVESNMVDTILLVKGTRYSVLWLRDLCRRFCLLRRRSSATRRPFKGEYEL